MCKYKQCVNINMAAESNALSLLIDRVLPLVFHSNTSLLLLIQRFPSLITYTVKGIMALIATAFKCPWARFGLGPKRE